MKDLSIIIVSYNTLDVTRQCFEHLENALQQSPSVSTEIIMVDNNSTDGSVEMIKDCRSEGKNIEVKALFLEENMGFSKGNNRGLAIASGKYVLFLNSDVYVTDVNFADIVHYMDEHEKVGALTVRVELPNGNIDPASHRGYPSLWNAFTYFSRLEKMFAPVPFLNRVFGGYHLTHLNLTTIHEIDSPTGAFYFSRTDILKKIHGFDEDYFMYGEDIDLSFRIKELGYRIIYYPLFTVVHLKYQSGLQKNAVRVQKKTGNHFFEAMSIFYNKRLAKKNSRFQNMIVHHLITLKSKLPR